MRSAALTPPSARSRNAELIRRLRAEAVARGDCLECRCRPAATGRRTCTVCLEKHAERKKAYTAVGLCRCGRRPVTGLTTCAGCTERRDESIARRYWKRRLRGLCAAFGCARPARPGRACCESCAAAAVVRAVEWQAQNVLDGLCAVCRRPNPEPKWRCAECRADLAAYAANRSRP